MTYNGYVADLFFNACAIAMWAAFLWRVLDGPRFRVWVTVLLAALIGAAYMAATLLLTTVGQLRALMFPVCSLAMAFLLFRGTPGRKLLAVAAELAGSLLMEMMFTPLMIDLQSNDDISVWADPRALIYGVTFLPVLARGWGCSVAVHALEKQPLRPAAAGLFRVSDHADGLRGVARDAHVHTAAV
ncbi:MAG: hypothetical protein ACLU0Z_06935 [Oscillospiraceae bacterium]